MLFHTAVIANGPHVILREVTALDPESGRVFYCHQKIAFDLKTIEEFCAHRFYSKLPLLETNDILATGSPRPPMLDKIFSVFGEPESLRSNFWMSSALILQNYQPELFEKEDFIRQFTAFFVKHSDYYLEMSALIEQGLFSVERFNLIEFIASCLGNPFPAITEFLTPICNVEMPLDHKSAFVDGHLNGAMAQVMASMTDSLNKINRDAKAPLLRAIRERNTKSEQSAQLKAENQQLSEAIGKSKEEKKSIESELPSLTAQVEELRRRHNEKQKTIRNLTTQAKQDEDTLALAKDRLLKSGEEQKELERMGSELPGMHERYCTLKQGFDVLQQQCAESEKELKKSQEKKEKQRAQITAIDADLIKAKQGFEARQKNLAGLQKTQAEVEEKTERLQSVIAAKEREMTQANERLEKTKHEWAQLQQRISQAEREHRTMQGKYDEAAKQINQETCKIRQAREQLLKAEQERKQLEAMEEKARAQCATTQKTLSALQQQCDEAEKKRGEMGGKLQEIARALLMAQQEITQKEADFQQTQQALEAIRKRTAQADQDLNGAAREFSVSSELPRASSQTPHSVFSEESAEKMAKTLHILHRQLCCVGSWQRYDRGEGSKRTEQLQQQTEQLRQQIEQLQQQMGTMLRRPQQTTAVAVPVIPALTQQGMRFMLPFTAPISSQSGGTTSTPQQKRPGG
ncbi:MAG: hypothetical protein A2103_05085 [Gammaproteobacteria bacterium GWF2_41_13]|nr:MAG: hypothetical protein A2103_05085 [Gammaproteobacteria bacterium GWF2_41_13]